MISKMIRVIFTLAVIGVAVFVVIQSDSYTSLIPDKYYSYVEQLLKPTKVAPVPQEEVVESPVTTVEQDSLLISTPADTLVLPEAIDSLAVDSLKVE